MEVKYLLNVNDDILPASIKNEFNKIRLEFSGRNNNTNVIIPAFRKLYELHSKGLLFENEDDENVKGIFTKLTNQKLSLFIKEYQKGFKEGYDNNNYLNVDFVDNSDNKIKINRVFTEVYEKFNKLKFYLIDLDNSGFLCIKLHFYEFGHEVGIFLKCWDTILNNYFLFEEIFHKYYNQNKEEEQQQAISFVNNFDKVKPTEIFNHFKAGLVDNGYLTEQELNEYLKAAFELQIVPETLFKIKDAPTKQKITNIFYRYFKNIAGTPHGRQKEYAALLGDYFEGFVTKNVSTNFNK